MEGVADESRIYDHQNDASDKMNGSASREADASDNTESTSLGDDISKLKSKLSDLQSVTGDQEPTNPTNESSTEVEHSSLQDDSAKEASSRSMNPSNIDAAKDSEIPGSPISEGDFEEPEDELEEPADESVKPIDEPEKPVDELEQPIDKSTQPVDGSEQSIGESEQPLDESNQHISKPDQNAAVDVANEVSTSQDGAQKDTSSENMEIEPSLKDNDPDPSELQEDEETQNSNPIDVNSPTSVSMVDETSVNAESANPESPAENPENDPLSKDGEVQDSGGNDAECSKSIPEDSEDKSMDHNDIDNHSDSSSRIDGNSCEPTEKTRFLSMDQDSVPEDVDMETRGSPENVEDPFSTGPEESSEVSKPTEEPEDASEAQETSEEPDASSVTKETVEGPKESSEVDETSKEAGESSEVLQTAEKLSESRESAEEPKESSDKGKAAEEEDKSPETLEAIKESDKSSIARESMEEPEESSEARKTNEELESSDSLEKTKESRESLEMKESVEAPEGISQAGKVTGVESSVVPKTVKEPVESAEKRDTDESPKITKTTVEAKESSEKEVTTKKSEESSGEKKALEGVEKCTEAKETAKGAETVQKSSDKIVSEDLSSGDAVIVVNKSAEAETKSTDATKPQDDLMDAPESPSLLVVDEPELMEIDDTPETSATEMHSKEAEKELAAAIRSIDGSKKMSKPAIRDPRADEVIIDDDDDKVVQKTVIPTKPTKAVSRGRKKSSVATGSGTENICIVPDLPEIETVTSLAPLMEKDTPSPVTPSGRTQRRAAKTAGIKMKKMMASMSDATDDSVGGKNAIQSAEKAVSSANFVRKCAECKKRLIMSESCLFWETMEFCNEACLGSYLTKLGEFCANCKGNVQPASLGKYCVRFGTDINQFCCSQCLEEFKKGLKVCSYCQKDISSGPEGFLAPVGDKGQFKDFCSQECMVLYEAISNNVPEPTERHPCAVCKKDEIVNVKVRLKGKETKLCNDICFAAFKFANSIECEKCNMCRKYYVDGSNFVIYYEDELHTFCSKTCMNVYILGKRRIILCNTCKVKKYNFDMIKRVLNNGTTVMACSLNCLALYQIQKNSSSVRAANACENCGLSKGVQYYLNMSDGTARNFCSLVCTMNFQTQCKLAVHSNVYPTSGPKRVSAHKKVAATTDTSLPVISTVTSLAQANGPKTTKSNSHPPSKTGVIQQIVMRPPIPKSVHNKIIQCRPAHSTKGVSCKPFMTTKGTQTEEEKQALIPIPVPIYVPLPCSMYKLPVPFAVPIPLPIPVPIFVPTTRNSAKGIMKHIKKIQKKIPQDPFEAELLMMAEMVAEDKKADETTSSEDDEDDDDNVGDASVAGASLHNESEDDARAPSSSGNQSPAVSTRSSISCKAPHLDDLADIEDTLKPATIVPTERSSSEQSHDIEPPSPPIQRKARKRTSNSSSGAENLGVKRVRRSQEMQETSPMAPSPPLEIIRPDANMNLKYTYGVNAWRQWVIMKNMEVEKTAKTGRKSTPFKTDLLKLTPDELSFTLCLFLKEVKKPNGTEYAPDTLYYFCLGIQHYLYENGRVDNLFTDPFYEPFTDRLDEVGIKFSSLYDGTRQIVTRIEEEHLWESKQLGAHSPHVLLNTLMFFNTKHFNLATVDEHMQLSFAHIMKHWKRNSGGAAIPASSKHQPPGNRNVLLRFYPPQSALEGNSRKKKMYEQRENEENPLRCPVKLYEFYLSKCPESVKTRNDVFYLLPERSCVPDSPVWYSTMALDKKSLMKSLNRIKMVKEVNIALLTL